MVCRNQCSVCVFALITLFTLAQLEGYLSAAEVELHIEGAPKLKVVGLIQRWDRDGNPIRPVDPKAKIDAPACISGNQQEDGTWVFSKLSPGRYDAVILGNDRLRIDGFDFPPVLEFDPFFCGGSSVEEEHRQAIEEDIRGSRHYENKVEPLYFGGNDQVVRVLVMLIRDLPTSYEGDFPGAATIRHEIWQYTWAYGGWKKEKRTRVIDRCILHRDELRKWTWLWDPRLGGIEIKSANDTAEITYQFPDIKGRELKGLYPY
ncbi:MAG: hypothetical protein ACUVQG_02990 [Thermogutta sp.]